MVKKSLIFGGFENINLKYVTIHSRWLEASCESRLGDNLPKDECWMTPSYIKLIMGDVIDRPIVFIGDGQNKEVLAKLKNDTDIGQALVIPQELFPDHQSLNQPISDMMIAIMGDTFIGTRVSTFATIVGLSRVIIGADPASNYIYTSRNESTANNKTGVEVCKDCLFLCDPSQSDLCGREIIYT